MSTITRKSSVQGVKMEGFGGFSFLPPGNIADFPTTSLAYKRLLNLWNQHVNAFTLQAMAGSPWNTQNVPPTTNYFNPENVGLPPNSELGVITWNPFPGRLQTYFSGQLSINQMYQLADTGYCTGNNGSQQTFPQITQFPCSAYNGTNFPAGGNCGCEGAPGTMIPYGPYGPRGWQDEYCEWSVEKDSNGNIIRIDFTCENPEYWNTLWNIDPGRVLTLYQQTLGKPQIKLEDLYLTDSKGKPVIDPGLGIPAYNPLNKWNSGPVSTATQGGAMHLTATPNTLQTEIGEAASATVLRMYNSGPNKGQQIPSSDKEGICCSGGFGQYGRNSDPNIGAGVNGIVSSGNTVTLNNPPGLYLQVPDAKGLNSIFNIPGLDDIAPYFKITRGGESITVGSTTYQTSLHLTVEAPELLQDKFPLSKLQINGQPMQWASQITQQLGMAIFAVQFPGPKETPLGCALPMPTTTATAEPNQLFHADIFNAMYATNVPNPVGFSMTLLSNSNFVPPVIHAGETYNMVLTYTPVNGNTSINPGDKSTWPAVSFTNNSITAVVTAVNNNVNYAVPGNSYPGTYVALTLSVTAHVGVLNGYYGVFVNDACQSSPGPAMPALISVN